MERLDKLVINSIIGETDSVKIGDNTIKSVNDLILWVQDVNGVDRGTAKDLIANSKVLLRIAFIVA